MAKEVTHVIHTHFDLHLAPDQYGIITAASLKLGVSLDETVKRFLEAEETRDAINLWAEGVGQ